MTHLMVFDQEPRHSSGLVAALTALGFQATPAGLTSGSGEALRRERPGVAVLSDRAFAESPPGEGLLAAAEELGVPVLVVVDDSGDPLALADRLAAADDWVSRRLLDSELPARVARLVERRGRIGAAPEKANERSSLPADAHFLALVIHDLRSPLNVVGLSLRMISQAVPKGNPDVEEDLRFVEENYRQLERMLVLLSDYYRLFENDREVTPTRFDPRRLIHELLEARAIKPKVKQSPVKLDVRPSCPAEVELDPSRARLAVQYVLTNAGAASDGEPIRLTMHGGPDRWVIEAAVDEPPPASVHAVELSPRSFERLCGFAAERRGMDLAIAAKVSEIFGGSARLDVVKDQGTTVVLDWPVRLTPPEPIGPGLGTTIAPVGRGRTRSHTEKARATDGDRNDRPA